MKKWTTISTAVVMAVAVLASASVALAGGGNGNPTETPTGKVSATDTPTPPSANQVSGSIPTKSERHFKLTIPAMKEVKLTLTQSNSPCLGAPSDGNGGSLGMWVKSATDRRKSTGDGACSQHLWAFSATGDSQLIQVWNYDVGGVTADFTLTAVDSDARIVPIR